jgi:mono/diheme cytochrome c family protein
MATSSECAAQPSARIRATMQTKNYSFKLFAALGLLVMSIAMAGCGNDDSTDLVNGKTQFIAKCGGCHQMARAGTAGVQGPNLDDAFRQARRDGMGDTIAGVVYPQILYPSQGLQPAELNMPAKLVTGQDARDVAAYVAEAAAKPGKDIGEVGQVGGTDGKGLFKTNCGSCHVLSDAATSGAVGPNLDNLKPDLALVTKQVTNGGGGMPAFKGTLTPAQIKLIAKYVSDVAGK